MSVPGDNIAYVVLYDDRKLETLSPIKENYLKGPDMILEKNPKNYLTKIQLMIKKV